MKVTNRNDVTVQKGSKVALPTSNHFTMAPKLLAKLVVNGKNRSRRGTKVSTSEHIEKVIEDLAVPLPGWQIARYHQ